MSEADLGPVLVVEADEDARRALEWVLELGRYRSVAFGTGMDALHHLLDGNQPCLVIMEMRLPDMAGERFYGLVRAQPTLVKLPVLVYTDAEFIPTLPGIFAAVAKGADPGALLGMIDAACGRRRAAHAG